MTQNISSRIYLRVSEKLKEDFKLTVQAAGYANASECIRDMISLLTYGESNAPKLDRITKTLNAHIIPYATQDEAQKLITDFYSFLVDSDNKDTQSYTNWLAVLYRANEETMLAEISEPIYQEHPLVLDFYSYTGYCPSPSDLKMMIRTFYNDPNVRKDMRTRYTEQMRNRTVKTALEAIKLETKP